MVRYLAFSRQRVEHLYVRARYELDFYAAMASECKEVLGQAAPQSSHDLDALIKQAKALLAEPGAAIGAIRACAQQIMTRLSRLLGEVKDADALGRIERTVVRSSAEITAFDWSWYRPLKLERFPGDVRPLESFIPVHDASTDAKGDNVRILITNDDGMRAPALPILAVTASPAARGHAGARRNGRGRDR